MSLDPSLIEQQPLFQLLSQSAQIEVIRASQQVSLPENTLVFDCGSGCQMLPLVLSGSIRVFKRSDAGREITLYRVTQDDLCIMTLSCLLGQGHYPATGVTETPVTAITLPAFLFRELIQSQPAFREKVMGVFSERLAELMQLVEEVSFHKLDQRLAKLLLVKGPIIHGSHQQLADELGSVREIVTRLLKHFQDQGWLSLARMRIEVLDVEPLRLYSENPQ